MLYPIMNTHNVPLSPAHYVKTLRLPQNWKYIIYCNATRGGRTHGHDYHAYKILVMFGLVVFETYSLDIVIRIVCTHPMGEVIIVLVCL